jgi:hypothetical protein
LNSLRCQGFTKKGAAGCWQAAIVQFFFLKPSKFQVNLHTFARLIWALLEAASVSFIYWPILKARVLKPN